MEKVLILHNSSAYFDKKIQKFELKLGAKIRLLAAAKLYQSGKVDKIVLTAGKLLGEDRPSVTKLSIPFLQKYGVKKSDLIIDDQALDTVDEINLSLPLVFGKAKKLLVLSDREHLKRIKILYQNRQVETEFAAAEDVLSKSKSEVGILAEYNRSKKRNFFKAREWFLRIWLLVDKKGKVINWVAHNLRKNGIKLEFDVT